MRQRYLIVYINLVIDMILCLHLCDHSVCALFLTFYVYSQFVLRLSIQLYLHISIVVDELLRSPLRPRFLCKTVVLSYVDNFSFIFVRCSVIIFDLKQ